MILNYEDFPFNKIRNLTNYHNKSLKSDLVTACQYLHLGHISDTVYFNQTRDMMSFNG